MATETAIDQPMRISRTETVTATMRKERTSRATIQTPRNGAYNAWIYREEQLLAADGSVLSAREIDKPVHRLASAIAGENVTLADGTVITAAQIMEALPLFFDRWAEEDIAAGRR